ncbi:hypothetical protein [Streptomyces sp. NWU49]|uniref:hypothetical protein n=1 Tax=Streptomyces sp. NWU49 TaxID=2201153 RepID=UPI0011B47326|nr:hypothetical protein [Streptomyces sp. NWU49]
MSQDSQLQGEDTSCGPLPTQKWKPTKRRAFLGRFAPAFYDAANTHRVRGQARPNAVLENAIGLMLCYDELWFVWREMCPADMQQLDFVRFVEDDSALMSTAVDAYEQCQEALPVPPGLLESPYIYTERIAKDPFKHHPYAKMTRSMRHPKHAPFWDWVHEHWSQWQDEHLRQEQQFQHLRQHLTNAMNAAGHKCNLQSNSSYSDDDRDFFRRMRLDFLQVAEWSVADALQLGPMDCIVNSGSVIRLDHPRTGDQHIDGEFEAHKVAAIEEVLHVRSTDALGPRGAYHEFIEDLRKDKRVKDLRDFLAGRPSPDGSAAALATEVEQLITTYQQEAFRRMHRPALLRTIGSMAIGAAGNKLLPGLGGVLSALVNADRAISDFNFRRDSQWAMFVVDARFRHRLLEPDNRRSDNGLA